MLLNLFILLFITICLVVYMRKNVEFYMTSPDIDLVIALLNNNNIEQVKELIKLKPFKNIYIYSLVDINDPTSALPNVIRVNDKGTEVMLYLYHIVNNYNNLANSTIFVTDKDLVTNETRNLITNLIEKSFADSKNYYYLKYENFQDIYSFSTQDNDNKIKPYGKWFNLRFSDVRFDYITIYNMLAIRKTNIYNRTLEFYKQLLNDSKNPELELYISKSWCAIFQSFNIENNVINK